MRYPPPCPVAGCVPGQLAQTQLAQTQLAQTQLAQTQLAQTWNSETCPAGQPVLAVKFSRTYR